MVQIYVPTYCCSVANVLTIPLSCGTEQLPERAIREVDRRMGQRAEEPRYAGHRNKVSHSFLSEPANNSLDVVSTDRDPLTTLVHRFTTPYRNWELGKGRTVNYSGNHKKSLHLSIRDSLEKLQTDYIDLLYVHWWVSSKTTRSPFGGGNRSPNSHRTGPRPLKR
jgi:hypothetical protein